MGIVLGIDVGGTFTDFVAYDTESRSVHAWKDFSTSGDPAEGILAGLKHYDRVADVTHVRLGTTIATNAILERKGATVGYITTRGFRDIPFIQRGNRQFNYSARWVKPEPLVHRSRCLEIGERVDCDGQIIQQLNELEVRKVAGEIRKRNDIEAVAVNLLFSYLMPAHEQRIREILSEELPGVPISTSFDVLPKWKEYERASTTIADAYVKPIVQSQLGCLEDRLKERLPAAKLAVIKSNGGETDVAGACASPVQMTLSGPSGGVIATQFIANTAGELDIITFDMGGTSTDCALCIGGQVALTTDFEIEWGLPIQTPMIDVRTIGAGGGSIAWIDKGGLLRVGPQSAGSRPGPVCYGRGGTEPTVTDANVVLGRINPDRFLGGAVTLDAAGSRNAISRIAEQIGLSIEETAQAILSIANNNIVGALRNLSVEKGHDPRQFALMGFGGAGPVHACDIVKAMGMPRAIVPVFPGQFSAFGFTATDARVDRQRTVQLTSNRMDRDRATTVMKALDRECRIMLAEQGYSKDVHIVRTIDIRYHGQNYELELPVKFAEFTEQACTGLWASFDRAHRERYGFNLPGEVVELVNFNVTAVHALDKPMLPPLPSSSACPKPEKHRRVMFSTQWIDTPVYRREQLLASQMIVGPALVEEDVSVTCLNPGQSLSVDRVGNLIIKNAE